MIKTGKLTSVRGAISLLLGDTSRFGKLFVDSTLSPIWFRGHSNKDWQLEPGVLRRNANDKFLYDEYNMLGEMRLIKPLDAEIYPTIFDWLVMCQHYGLPTRLLDWSESILVALFFASQNDNTNGVLFSLKPNMLNKQTTISGSRNLCLPNFPDAMLRAEQSVCFAIEEVIDKIYDRFGNTKFALEYIERIGGRDRMREKANVPVAVYPSRNNVRIIQQSGMFTVHGGTVSSSSNNANFGKSESLENLACHNPDILSKFIIPAKHKQQIRDDLVRLGVHHGSLFPEFESQTRYLRDKWTKYK